MNFKNVAAYRSQLKKDLVRNLPDRAAEYIDADVDGIVEQCIFDIDDAGDKVDGLVFKDSFLAFDITNKFHKIGEDVVVEYELSF